MFLFFILFQSIIRNKTSPFDRTKVIFNNSPNEYSTRAEKVEIYVLSIDIMVIYFEKLFTTLVRQAFSYKVIG